MAKGTENISDMVRNAVQNTVAPSSNGGNVATNNSVVDPKISNEINKQLATTYTKEQVNSSRKAAEHREKILDGIYNQERVNQDMLEHDKGFAYDVTMKLGNFVYDNLMIVPTALEKAGEWAADKTGIETFESVGAITKALIVQGGTGLAETAGYLADIPGWRAETVAGLVPNSIKFGREMWAEVFQHDWTQAERDEYSATTLALDKILHKQPWMQAAKGLDEVVFENLDKWVGDENKTGNWFTHAMQDLREGQMSKLRTKGATNFQFTDETIWANKNMPLWEKVLYGVNITDLLSDEGAAWAVETGTSVTASAAQFFVGGAGIAKSIAMAGLKGTGSTIMHSAIMSTMEGAPIGEQVYKQVIKDRLDRDVGDPWKRASQKVWEQVYEESLASGAENMEAQHKAGMAVDNFADNFLKQDPELEKEIRTAASKGAQAVTTANLATLGTGYIDALTFVRGTKALARSRKYTSQSGSRIKPLSKKGHTRKLESKQYKFGDPETMALSYLSESIEEGMINSYAEWYGHAVGMGEEFTASDFMNKFRAGESFTDMIWGGIAGVAQTAGISTMSYKSRKQAYDQQQDVIKTWEKIGNTTDRNTLQDMTTFITTVNTENDINKQIEKAKAKGKDLKAEKLHQKKLHVQALRAFETGTTEGLLEAYDVIANNSTDKLIREKAKEARESILNMEKHYNESREFLNSDDVYYNKIEKDILERDHASAKQRLEMYKQDMTEDLDSAVQGTDITYSFNKNGEIVFKGKGSKEFATGAIQRETVSNYNEMLNSNTTFEAAINYNHSNGQRLVTPETQNKLRKNNKVLTIMDKDRRLNRAEDEEVYKKRVEKILDDNKVDDNSKQTLSLLAMGKFRSVEKARNKANEIATAKKDSKKSLIPRGVDAIRKAWKDKNKDAKIRKENKTGEHVDAFPGEAQEGLSPQKREMAIQGVKNILQDGDIKTFEEMMRFVTTPTGNESAESLKAEMYGMFDAFVDGWEGNGNPPADYAAVKANVFSKRAGMDMMRQAQKMGGPTTVPPTQPGDVELAKELDKEKKKAPEEATDLGTGEVDTEVRNYRRSSDTSVKLQFVSVKYDEETESATVVSRSDKANQDTLVDNNVVQSGRLLQLDKFGPGYGVSFQVAQGNLATTNIPIYEGEVKSARVTLKNYLGQKFGARKAHATQGHTTVEGTVNYDSRTGNLTFKETRSRTGKDGKVEYYKTNAKLYDQRQPGGERKYRHLISSDFLIVHDNHFNQLNDENVVAVDLLEVDIVPSKDGQSTIRVNIGLKDGTVKKNVIVPVENEIEMNERISAHDGQDDVAVGFLHNYQWYNKGNLKDDKKQFMHKSARRAAQQNLAAFRKQIINSPNGSIATMVKDRTNWKTFLEREYKNGPYVNRPMNERDPGRKIAIVKGRKLYVDGKPLESSTDTIIYNHNKPTLESGGAEGFLYEAKLIQNRNGKNEWIVSKLEKPMMGIDSIAFNNITWALKTYFGIKDSTGELEGGFTNVTQEQAETISKTINEKYLLDLGNDRGFNSFIKMFTNTKPPASLLEDKDGHKIVVLKNFSKWIDKQNVPDNTPFLMTNGGIIYFGMKNKQITEGNAQSANPVTNAISVSRSSTEEEGLKKESVEFARIAIQNIEAHGLKMRFDADNTVASNDKKMQNISREGVVEEGETYTEYLKPKYGSAMDSWKDGEGKSHTGIQPSIVIDTGETVVDKVTNPSTKQPADQPPVSSPEGKVTQQDILESIEALDEMSAWLGTGRHKQNDAQDAFPILTDEDLIELIKVIPGLTVDEQARLVNVLYNDVVVNLRGKSITADTIDQYMEGLYERTIGQTKNIVADRIAQAETRIATDPVAYAPLQAKVNEVKAKLSVYDSLEKGWSEIEKDIRIRLKKFAGMSKDTMEEASAERDIQYSQSAEERHSKDTAPFQLRRFIAGTELLNENGEALPTVFGLPQYVNYDEAFDLIAQTLAGAQRAGLTFEEALWELQNRSQNVPWMKTFVKRLGEADQSMKNMFMYTMQRHSMSMQFIMFGKDENGHFARVYDTNSAEVSQTIQQDWENTLRKSNLVIPGTSHINTKEANNLVQEYGNGLLKNKSDDEIMAWLAKVGIVLSKEAFQELKTEGMYDAEGNKVTYDEMWGISESGSTSALFAGIHSALSRFGKIAAQQRAKGDPVVIDMDVSQKNQPFGDISNTVKSLAKIQAKYSTRKPTTSFRAGGKSISGIIQTSFATDRMGHLTSMYDEDSGVAQQLRQDPFSQSSLILELLRKFPHEMKNILRMEHVSLDALKEKGKATGEDNAITNLSQEDLEFLRASAFFDVKQGQAPSTVDELNNEMKMRVARTFFPTMSDKPGMFMMRAPVFDFRNTAYFSKRDDGDLDFHGSVKDILFEQLVLPELKRIHDFHLNLGSSTDITGYDFGAHLLLLFPGLNDVTNREGQRVIEMMALNPSVYTVEKVIQDFKPAFEKKLTAVLNDEINKKISLWNGNNISQILNGEYFVGDIAKLPKEEQLHRAAADFVLNNFIAQANINMLFAGDMAFFTTDKVFDQFGYDENFIGNHRSLKGLPDFKTFKEQLDILKPKLTDEEYNRLKEQVKPLPYRPPSIKNPYEKLMGSVGTNLNKRLALLITPGDKLANSKGTQYLQLFADDVILPASNIAFLIKIFYGDKGMESAKARLEKLETAEGVEKKAILSSLANEFSSIEDYFAIESTDGQEYTTAYEHITNLYNQGRLNDSQYNMLESKLKSQFANGVNEDNKFDDDNLKLILQPFKPVATGSVWDSKLGKMRMMYVKSSSFPLIPQVTTGNKQLDDLRIAMEKLENEPNVDMRVRLAFKTAVKVGATKSGIDVTNPESLTVENMLKNSVVMERDLYRIQQDTPVHALEGKSDEVLIGTQLMKLLFGNGVTELGGFKLRGVEGTLTGTELMEQYNDTFGEIVRDTKNKLFKRLHLEPNGRPSPENKKKSMEAISELLKEQAESRGRPQQEIDGLSVIEMKNGNITFASPLWSGTNAVRYESLLNSIVTNSMIKLKLPGYSYVAGTENGFHVTDDVKGLDQSRMIYTKHWNKKLKPQNSKGRAQIFLPSRFRNNEGVLIDLFEGEGDDRKYIQRDSDGNWKLKDGMVSDELLSMTTFRIPTSSHSLAANVDIAGFLPPEMGDLMIVPKEFQIQKGLDYDIDKEYGYMLWHHTNDDGSIGSVEDMADNLEHSLDTEIDLQRQSVRDIKKEGQLQEVIDAEQQKLSNLEALEDKLRQNKIVRITFSVMDNSKMNSRVNKVLSMKFAREQADLLDEKKVYNSTASDEHHKDKMEQGASGKMGIGTYANHLVMVSMLQQLEEAPYLVGIDPETEQEGQLKITIGNHTSDGSLGRLISIPDSNTLSQLNSLIKRKYTSDANQKKWIDKLKTGKVSYDWLVELTSEYDKSNLLDNIRTVSEAFDERANTATDNANEGIMGRTNVNSQTIGVDAMLTMLGFDMGETITVKGKEHNSSMGYMFVSQPIIKKFVKQANASMSNINPDKKSLNDIIKEIRESLGEIEPAHNTELTAQNLWNNIENSRKGISNPAFDLAVLNMFVELKSYAKDFSEVTQLVNVTKEGLGQTMIHTFNKYDATADLSSMTSFSGIERLVGEYKNTEEVDEMTRGDIDVLISKGWVEFDTIGITGAPKHILIKPTTIMGHMLTHATTTGADVFGKFFPYRNISFVREMDNIAALADRHPKDMGMKDRIKWQQKVTDDLRRYMHSMGELGMFEGDPSLVRERLLMDREGERGQSLAAYLQHLQVTGNPVMTLNSLLNKFKFDIPIKVGSDISKIIYDNTAATEFDEEYMYEAVYELLDNNKLLPDNKNFDPGISDRIDLSFAPDTKQAILDGKKKVQVMKENKHGLQVGQSAIQDINGQRFIITNMGDKSYAEYNTEGRNFHLDNGRPPSELEKEFVTDGKQWTTFSIKPVYDTHQLVRDLLAYSFSSGGIQGAIEFVKYIPFRILERAGYTSKMNSLDFETHPDILETVFGTNQAGYPSSFTVQYYQHHPDELTEITPYQAGIRPDMVKDNPGFPKKLKGNDKMVVIRNFDAPTKPWNVYLLSNGVYIRIPTLGTHGSSEFNQQMLNANSILHPGLKQPSQHKGTVSGRSANANMMNFGSGNILDVLDTIEQVSLNEHHKELARLLKGFASPDVKLGSLPEGSKMYAAYNRKTNTLEINQKAMAGQPAEFVAKVILHEYIHSITSRELIKYFDADGNPLMDISKMPKHVRDLYTVFQEVKRRLLNAGEMEAFLEKKSGANTSPMTQRETDIVYAVHNIREFVTMALTEPKFQEAMKGETFKNTDQTLWDKFKSLLADLFQSLGIEMTDDLLTASKILTFEYITTEAGTATGEGIISRARTLMGATQPQWSVANAVSKSNYASPTLRFVEFINPRDTRVTMRIESTHSGMRILAKMDNLEFSPVNPEFMAAMNTRYGSTEEYVRNVLGEGALTGLKYSVEAGEIAFGEDPVENYQGRTFVNASADATIAIAINFESRGERDTKDYTLSQGKEYIPIDISSGTLQITQSTVNRVVKQLNNVGARSINIAGNSIATIGGKYTQEEVDNFTHELLQRVFASPELHVKPESIRSGGQTGLDEAGAKAGKKLGIPTLVYAPKGWRFKDIQGRDIKDEALFKERFGVILDTSEAARIRRAAKNPVEMSFFDGKPVQKNGKWFTYRTNPPKKTTIELIRDGTRTQTTRKKDKKKFPKEGDIIVFHDSPKPTNKNRSSTEGQSVAVRVTSAPSVPSREDFLANEGWHESVWEQNGVDYMENYMSYTFDYIGDVNENGELVVPTTETAKPGEAIPPSPKPAETTTEVLPDSPLFDANDKELKPGNLVMYDGKQYLMWNVSETGKARLMTTDGTKFNGTPLTDKIEILGTYATTNYNGTDYIVTEDESIISTATGKKVYEGTDDSSQVQRQRILQQVLKPEEIKGPETGNEENPSNPINGKTLKGEQVEAGKKANEWLKTAFSFKPAGEQLTNEEILNNLFFLLSGQGGTGKTFTTEVVLEGKTVHAWAAPTHQAKDVLSANLGPDKRGLPQDAVTVQALLGIKPMKKGFNFAGKSMKTLKHLHETNSKELPDIFSSDFIVIDEASMIAGGPLGNVVTDEQWDSNTRMTKFVGVYQNPPLGSYLMEIIKLKYELTGQLTKVFFMGDIVQTVPIKSAAYKVSDILESIQKTENFAMLEQVRRLDDKLNPGVKDILTLNNNIREIFYNIHNAADPTTIPAPLREVLLSANYDSPNLHRFSDTGLQVVNRRGPVSTSKVMVETYLKLYNENMGKEQPDPNFAAIINYNNAEHPYTISLTNVIRKQIFGEEMKNEINPNEIIITNTVANATLKDGSFIKLGPDTKMVVQSVRDSKKTVKTYSKGMVVIPIKEVKATINHPKKGIVNITIELSTKELNNSIKGFWKGNPGILKGYTAEAVMKIKNDISHYAYGYTINTHKVQGSGIEHAIVDAENILTGSAGKEDVLHITTFLYTALSRTRSQLYINIRGKLPKKGATPPVVAPPPVPGTVPPQGTPPPAGVPEGSGTISNILGEFDITDDHENEFLNDWDADQRREHDTPVDVHDTKGFQETTLTALGETYNEGQEGDLPPNPYTGSTGTVGFNLGAIEKAANNITKEGLDAFGEEIKNRCRK